MKKRWLTVLLMAAVVFLMLAAAPKQPAKKYVGSSKSPNKIFHRLTCGSAKRIDAKNAVFFKDAADATKKGYVPCQVCKPN